MIRAFSCLLAMLFFCLSFKGFGQADTAIVNKYNNLSREFVITGEYLKADSLSHKALILAKKLNYKKGIFYAYINTGVMYWYQDNFPVALKNYLAALTIAEQLNDKVLIARALANTGLLFWSEGEYEKALDYYLKSITLKKELGDKKAVTRLESNIGNTYRNLNNIEKALEYFTSSLTHAKNDKDSGMIALNLSDIGKIYEYQGESKKALENFYNALDLTKSGRDHVLMPKVMGEIAKIYLKQKKYSEAEKLLIESVKIAKDMGNPGNEKDLCILLNELYSAQNNWKLAHFYYKRSAELKDTIFNEEKTKALVRNEMNFSFDKKQAFEKMEQEKKDIIAAEELKQHKMQRNYFIAGFALMIIVAALIWRGYREKQKANKIIEGQKKEVEKQKEIVEEQKQLVEEHQKEIVDSINYAKRIQFALLASDSLLNANLPEHFVLFKPKDVVSGDFYWASPTPNGFLYITADCTGHGVPGAFMSLLNISKLSQTINENKIYRPELVLNNVRTEIVNALNPPGSTQESKDGMDAILCNLDVKNMRLEYAAANNSFYIVRDSKLLLLKADKTPVGKGNDDSISFTYNEFALEKGDTIYTLTDGYADQFGGEKGKKFKYKQLEEILISINPESMERQREVLLQRFNDWKGDLEQVDDVCIIGVRV